MYSKQIKIKKKNLNKYMKKMYTEKASLALKSSIIAPHRPHGRRCVRCAEQNLSRERARTLANETKPPKMAVAGRRRART